MFSNETFKKLNAETKIKILVKTLPYINKILKRDATSLFRILFTDLWQCIISYSYTLYFADMPLGNVI